MRRTCASSPVRRRRAFGQHALAPLAILAAAMSVATAALAGPATASPATAGPATASPATAGRWPGAASPPAPLIYDYEFRGATGTVNNSAARGPVAPLTLSGAWTAVPGGVYFTGDTQGNASVGYANPAQGYTLHAPARWAVGVGARIIYRAPAAGTCFGDTPNITQIGRYSAHSPDAQVKLQLSDCTASPTQVSMECRFAGSLTASGAPPVVSTLPLVSGDAYNVTCMKSPDATDGTATITLTVTDLSVTTGSQSVTNTFTVPALGYLWSYSYLSAGNKYPLPPPAANTDQFNGVITRVVYCAGHRVDVRTCLAAHLP
jgi:hypothetical protein